MTKILTAILAVVAVTALVVVGVGGALFGGVAGFGGGNNQTVTVSVPGVSVPGATQVAIPAPIASSPLPPIGGSIYNRMIDFTAGITVDGGTTSLATTTVKELQATGAVTFDSDLYVNGTFLPAYISTTTTSTLATTTISKLDVDHVYVVGNVEVTGTLDVTGDTTLADATTTNLTIVTALQSIGTLIIEGLSTFGATTTVNATLVATKVDAGSLVQGGSVLAITTASTTLSSTQVCEYSVITQIATTSKTTAESVGTLTLPTQATLEADCLKTDGDMVTLLFRNSTSSFGASTTIAAGNGIDLLEPSGGDVIIVPQESVRLDFTRESSSTTTVEVTSLQKAD